MTKYLLSTGRSTYRVEYYVMDLIKMSLLVYPGDIPGNSDLGFNFLITNTLKSNLAEEVKSRLKSLVEKLQKKFGNSITITLGEVVIIDETRVKVQININQTFSDEIEFDLYKEEED